MRYVAVIAWNTFRENLRDKILYNLVIFAVLLIGVAVLLGGLTIAEQSKLLLDLGLAAINLVGVVLAVFVGIGLVSKEIERRTVYTIMARPITRAHFILGKYFGLSLTLLINVAIMGAAFFGTLWWKQVPMTVSLLQGLQLIFMELLLVTALALFFSTFTSSVLSGFLALVLYGVGHMTGDLKGLAEKTHSEVIHAVMTGLYYVCPNLELLNIKGQAAAGTAVSLAYQAMASAYGLLYAATVVAAACLVFHYREF
jgi:ABC-type transport system involved in multi-copper enzyme maturation permease subunit